MLFNLLSYVSALSALTPLLISLPRLKTFNKPLKLLFVLFCVSAITEACGFFLFLFSESTIPIFYLYTIAEGSLLMGMYYYTFSSKNTKTLVLFDLILFLILAVFIFLFNLSHEYLNGTEGVLLLLLSGLYFYQLQYEVIYENITANAFFWINSAIFFYFGTNLFVLLFENTLRFSGEFVRDFSWSIHHTSNIVYNIVLSFGIWKVNHK